MQELAVSRSIFSVTIIDLAFLRSGVRKTITKYIGRGGYCHLCRCHYRPPKIVRLSTQLFGYNFQAWAIYQRIVLRLPYRAISQVSEELFGKRISDGSIGTFILRFSRYYVGTERLLLRAILDSPVIHVDETKINVQGFSQYVWVLTDGAHVIFRLTETRDSTVVQELLENYQGTLILDPAVRLVA